MSDADSFNLCEYFLSPSRLATLGKDPAIIYRGESLTYADLRRLVDVWAARLVRGGIGEGDRVALALYDSPIFVAAFLACASVGAISVPVNTSIPAEDVRFIVRDSGARLVICESELRERLASLEPTAEGSPALTFVDARRWSRDEIGEGDGPTACAPTSSDAPAFMLYTSGSTGTPKGALHRHAAPRDTALTYGASVLRLTPADRVYSSSRLFFAYGLGNSLTFPLAAGAAVILDCERPTPERIAQVFAGRAPTAFFGVPAVYRALLDYDEGAPLDTSSLRLCVSAGESLPGQIFEDWRERFGLEILDGIGSTEMLHIFISNRPGDARAGSSGRVVEGYGARLLDDAGVAVGADAPGNLWVKGASGFAGYWNRADLTAATIQEGWVKTGDVYLRDGEGFYYHVGRSDDCFKVSGLWVSPVEVENVLVTHPAVVEAAVVAATGADGLATARAFVVIRPEEDAGQVSAELIAFSRARLPRYKAPSQVVVVESLPRTVTGKVQRFKLRQRGVNTTSEGQA
ncbi:MAG TPA: benzoate-CoA ligase family protein [Blastocatellia bacterium]|nr:benzoate-CoA ligase family protein [Blastocatellia bacterium]